MTAQLGEKLQIVGDDLFASNPTRIIYGIENKAANAAVIKAMFAPLIGLPPIQSPEVSPLTELAPK